MSIDHVTKLAGNCSFINSLIVYQNEARTILEAYAKLRIDASCNSPQLYVDYIV